MKERNRFRVRYLSTTRKDDLAQLSSQELLEGLSDANFIRNMGAVVLITALAVFADQSMAPKWETVEEGLRKAVLVGLDMLSFSVGLNMTLGGISEAERSVQEAKRRGLSLKGWLNKQIEQPPLSPPTI